MTKTTAYPDRITLGEIGYTHPDAPGILFSSLKAIRESYNYPNLDPSRAKQVDTRPTYSEVRDYIIRAEQNVWDEYFSLNFYRGTDDNKWPDRYRWVAVYVVMGSSEGIYLHIDIIIQDQDGSKPDVRKHIFTGKTLSCNYEKWQECYESAGRIAWMLGA